MLDKELAITTAYQELAEYIQAREGKCVLILGPGLSVNQDGVSYKSYFREIASDNSNGAFIYFENENLFAFNEESTLKNTRRLVKEFYKSSGDAALLEMIATIRFPLIINVCPDLSLNKIYEAAGINFSPAYFSKDSGPKFKDLSYPTKDKPVIYNIFGSVDTDTSLILNHSKLYETIQYLLSDNSLPENIETFLKQASGFLLLGMKFDSWYYQLICHKLKLKDYNSPKINLSASCSNDTDSVSVIMRKNFEIDFTNDNPMQSIGRLISECNNNTEALRDIQSLGAYSLFVSYAWKDKDAPAGANRETFVDWSEKFSMLSQVRSLRYYRDHKDLKFGDSIDSFMTRIGKGKILIRVISDKYLKSRYCMTEALRMDKYRDDEQRILTVIWEDANLENEIMYRDYWREKCQSILEDIAAKIDNDNYDHAVHIYRFLPKFINRLKDEISLRIGKNDFTIGESGEIEIISERKSEFEHFINTIIDKVKT